MWLGTNKGFYSIAKVPAQFLGGKGDNKIDENYAVRARDEQYLKVKFPNKQIFTYTFSDYQYRVYLTKQELNKFMLDEVENIDYDNFKNSVNEQKLHYFYMKVWEIALRYLSK